MSVLSVTEVRNALRCPRIFALGRLKRAAVAFPIGSSCLGASFHRLVDRFAKTIDAPAARFAALPKGSPIDAVEAELRAWLLGLLGDELEANAALATMPGEVDDLAQALRELARHFAGRLARFDGPPASALRRLVQDSERPLEIAVEDGVIIRGKLDALYGDPDGSLEVIEYKLTDEANDALDRAQVALYAYMLERSGGPKVKAAVLRFMPMLRETALSPHEATDILERRIRPVVQGMARWSEAPETAPATDRRDLCPACPLAEACAETYPTPFDPRDQPPARGTRPKVDPEGVMQPIATPPPVSVPSGDEDGRKEAVRLHDLIIADLKRGGVKASCPRPPLVGPSQLVVEVASRGSVSALDKCAPDVVHHLENEWGKVVYDKQGGRRSYVAQRRVPRTVTLAPLLAEDRDYLAARAGRFVLGQRPDGAVLHGDLSDSSTPHLLIGGTTGSGKSVLLRALIASLVHFHGPSAIRFLLIDPKRVTFNVPAFQSAVGSHLEGPIGYDSDDAIPVIERLVEVMEHRYELFERTRVVDLPEYNEQAAPADRLERKVIVIDEFQDLTADKSTAKPFFEGVKRLGAKARGAGVHIILATQRPDRDVVPPLLKTNLGGRIALRVASQVNSRIILDEGGAEGLFGKGDLLANLGQGLVRAQAPFVG